MGTNLRVLSESYPMNTNMTWFRGYSKIFASLCFGRLSSLSIGRVKGTHYVSTPEFDKYMMEKKKIHFIWLSVINAIL